MKRTKPPFRADHVGSLLRTAPVKEAREARQRGAIDADGLREIEDREIAKIVKKQEEAGLQSITDGEFRRSWWHLDFLWGLDGVERYQMAQGISFAGMRTRAEGARAAAKVGFTAHPMIGHFAYLKSLTGLTAKMTIPAPSALYGRTGREAVSAEAYPSLDTFFAEWGTVYRHVVRAFADAGCRYLQLDEVFIPMLCDAKYRQTQKDRGDDPDRLVTIYADLINAAISDIPADMTVTMHMCRGNYRSTFMGSGGYEPVTEALFDRIKVHGYFMEYDTERAGDFAPLRLVPKDRIIVLGLVTTKTGELEDADLIKRRIEEAAKFIDADQLCLSPQCGFASSEEGNVLAEEEQWAKLRMIVEVAEQVWG